MAIPAALAAAGPAIVGGLKSVGSFIGTHGSQIGNFLGGTAALGSLFGGSSGGSNVAQSAALMRYQMNLQKDYTQWLNENQYSQLRTGLENAGYNPLLAMGASPQQGTIGQASVTNPESKTAQVMSVLSGLAQIENIKANTAQAQSGILGKLLGSEGIKNLKELFGSGDAIGIGRNIAKNIIDSITSNVASPAPEDKNGGHTILKGYVSNTAEDDSYDYTDKGLKLKVIEHPERNQGRRHSYYNMAPKSLPSGM